VTGHGIDPTLVRHHFDYRGPELGHHLHQAFALLRSECPVARSDRHGGYWIVTRHADVVRAAQDWEAFSSQLGVSIPASTSVALAIPEHIDPPLHRDYKRLINRWFTPAAVAPLEPGVRRIAGSLIDGFIERGTAEVMADFAVPFPGLVFFELVLGAPAEELAHVNEAATGATDPGNPAARDCWAALNAWIDDFTDRRRHDRRDDVVEAILTAQIEGRPIRDDEVRGLILLLILGGLDTTAGVIGQSIMRFCADPAIPERLRREPELLPDVVEELLRLDTSFVGIGRTVRHDTELAGQPMAAGDKVYLSWASANRDPDEFADPDELRLDRVANRHLAFGAGPHRCAGSHLARLNLCVAIGELVERLVDLRLAVPADAVTFHTAFNRRPLEVPVTFRPGTAGP
jgi:cytochrome P450